MADARDANMTIDWRQQFLWLHIFRVFRIAIDPRKMLLAGLGLLALSAGDWAFDRLPFARSDQPQTTVWPWAQVTESSQTLEAGSDATEMVRRVSMNWRSIVQPLADFIEPVRMLLQPELDWSKAADALTRLCWILLVWSLFGGAITRMTAVQFAREEQVGMVAALRFVAARLLLYFSAPLLPLAAVAFFWALCLLGGLVGRIPVAGEAIVGALWFLPLICGLLMALILTGVAVSWPLMFATISAEGSDAFDGLSRSYSYIFGRPGHFLWYGVVATAWGILLVAVVAILFSLSVYLAAWAVGSGMGEEGIAQMYSTAPESLGGINAWPRKPEQSPGIGAILAGTWLHAAALLKAGFAYSYFWSAMTIIYFLLRKRVDAADLNEIYRPDQIDEDELLPLVGVANSDQPVIERPAPEISESSD